ncbi:MAG: EAL domain-containing protein [Lachnospiraceae bacterium]|nr:EAL domain-containing protein [Lachnospiraceae bacterium]
MQKYHYSKAELKLIEESSIPCAVYQFIDKHVVTIALSDGFCKLLGLSSKEEAYHLMDNDMYRDAHPEDVARIADEAVRFATQGGEYNVVYRSKVGEDYIVLHAIGHHITRPTGERLAVINYVKEGIYQKDTGEINLGIQSLQEKLLDSVSGLHKNSYDYLTGLPDMDYFFDLAEVSAKKAQKQGKTAYMLFMNIKDMKSYNHRYGYAEGDVLIQGVAKVLVQFFGNKNCCRTTADHFAIYAEEEQIQARLEWLIQELKKVNGGNNLPVSIGVYSSRLGWVNNSTACDWAKVASDSDKTSFESTITYFDEKMLQRYKDRRYIFENLDRAIEEGWLQVYYQPIVRAANGRVCDEEALARWVDPERGLLSPAQFIPILEEAKLSYKLDLFVVDQVIEKLKKQAAGGLYVVPNSVNLSRTDFYCCDMVEEIQKRVEASGLEPCKITIEITESYIMEDTDFMKEQVERFQKLGFHVWMDDFGSGYSTPDLLQKVHFDVVKIDKSFVDKIDEGEANKILLSELVRLASSLGSETVAEGVETESQVEFLKEIGCTRLQGFNYCKPIPLTKILDRYEKGQQIGFENPAESEYYGTLGNINLYDMSFSLENDVEVGRYFDTMPMMIVEAYRKEMRIVRGNKSHREFLACYFPELAHKKKTTFRYYDADLPADYVKSILKCRDERQSVIQDVKNKRGDLIHLFVRHIADNPVTGTVAMAIVVLGCVNYDQERKRQEEQERLEQERKTYNRIMALSGDFLSVFSVDPVTNHYVEFSSNANYKRLNISAEGDDFYEESRKNGADIVYVEDLDIFLSSLTKENVMTEIHENGVFILNYRIRIGGVPKYVSLKATFLQEDDEQKVIFGLIDTDAQVKKDEEYSKKLMAARDIANLDALTGVKNKHAYTDAEMQMDALIDTGEIRNFAIVVFDINGLKEVNDTKGHQAGDQFIMDGCHMICHVFKHSPVFRVGGDEFVAIVQGEDYHNINTLMKKFEKLNERHRLEHKVVVAAGMSRCRGDKNISSVFRRADAAMYRNKKALKALD